MATMPTIIVVTETTTETLKRMARTIGDMARDVDESLASQGYGDYANKPSDRDWKKGYSQACKDAAKALGEGS